MNWTQRRESFRQIIAGNICITPASVFDPLSARMVEDLGGKVGMLAGSVAAMAILGAPDKTLITATEFSDMAFRICRAGNLAVIADADHGYGNAMNVQRTVSELDHAGLAAVTIEDTELPQPFGAKETKLLSLEEGIGKIKAALSGRSDPNMVILARTSAANVNGLDDCITRIKGYEKTGVDGIALIGMKSRKDLNVLCDTTRLPIMLGGIGSMEPDLDNLAKMGVRICLRGHQPYLAALAATYSAIQQVLSNTKDTDTPPLIENTLLQQLTRNSVYDDDAKRFL